MSALDVALVCALHDAPLNEDEIDAALGDLAELDIAGGKSWPRLERYRFTVTGRKAAKVLLASGPTFEAPSIREAICAAYEHLTSAKLRNAA